MIEEEDVSIEKMIEDNMKIEERKNMLRNQSTQVTEVKKEEFSTVLEKLKTNISNLNELYDKMSINECNILKINQGIKPYNYPDNDMLVYFYNQVKQCNNSLNENIKEYKEIEKRIFLLRRQYE